MEILLNHPYFKKINIEGYRDTYAFFDGKREYFLYVEEKGAVKDLGFDVKEKDENLHGSLIDFDKWFVELMKETFDYLFKKDKLRRMLRNEQIMPSRIVYFETVLTNEKDRKFELTSNGRVIRFKDKQVAENVMKKLEMERYRVSLKIEYGYYKIKVVMDND